MTGKMPIPRMRAKKDAANFEFTAPLYSVSLITDRLVSVMLRLVRAVDRNVDVLGLFLGQYG